MGEKSDMVTRILKYHGYDVWETDAGLVKLAGIPEEGQKIILDDGEFQRCRDDLERYDWETVAKILWEPYKDEEFWTKEGKCYDFPVNKWENHVQLKGDVVVINSNEFKVIDSRVLYKVLKAMFLYGRQET